VVQKGVSVRGNATRVLHALGGPVTSIWHGRGVVYGGSHWLLLQGIGSSGRGKPGGEVTGQEMDGGVLTLLGCPRWPWRRPGQRGVLMHGLCRVGLVLGFLQGGAAALGVDGGGGDRKRREREGVLARLASGYSSPSMPTEYDKGEKISPRSYGYREGDTLQPLLLLPVG
jgi:hypothetical protein